MSSLAYSGLGLNYTYGYDTLGNITSVVKNGSTEATYAYDLQNQLVSEIVGGNIYSYNYDTVGNLMSVQKNGSTTKLYTYGDSAWADLLTAFTVNGVTGSITYDNVGNPLTYYNGTSYAMTWTPERRLATLTGGGKSISYAYDMDGIRTSKTVNGTTTSYTTVSGQVVRETTGSTVIDFAYEDTGAPYAMRYNGSIYYYLLNLQGDVVGLVDAYGNTVASYSYDAWGNVLSATGSLAAINPLRYRGYYYDSETALYYVQSRYYDPMVGRWISADNVLFSGSGVTGYNLYSYCNNNPVIHRDVNGNFPWLAVIVVGVGAIVGATIGALSNRRLYEIPRELMSAETSLDKGETDENTAEILPMRPPETEAKVETPLSTGDRIINAAIGMGVGLAVGGGIVSGLGAAGIIYAGSAAASVPFLAAASGGQTFAIGALAYNVVAIVFAPLFGLNMEPIEYGS